MLGQTPSLRAVRNELNTDFIVAKKYGTPPRVLRRLLLHLYVSCRGLCFARRRKDSVIPGTGDRAHLSCVRLVAQSRATGTIFTVPFTRFYRQVRMYQSERMRRWHKRKDTRKGGRLLYLTPLLLNEARRRLGPNSARKTPPYDAAERLQALLGRSTRPHACLFTWWLHDPDQAV